MGSHRIMARRKDRHGFRPDLGGALEPRTLLSTVSVKTIVVAPVVGKTASSTARSASVRSAGVRAAAVKSPFIHNPRVLVERGGKGVRILDGRGAAFSVLLETGPGTITAKPRKDGRFDLIAAGTNSTTELVINPLRPIPKFGTAHTFQPDFGISSEILEVGDINIKTGKIGAILGYRTANLGGRILLDNDSPIDRIALNRLLPGALIQTTGDLDTLDVFTDADLSGSGTGIKVGRDLNWMLIGGNLTINDGATLSTARDIGLEGQAAKGTDPGGKGAQINGNVVIGPQGSFRIGRDVAGTILIQGNLNGASRLTVGGSLLAPVSVIGDITP